MSSDECWLQWERAEIGRLAVSGPDAVDIFPVNIAVDHRRIVFHTDLSTKAFDLTFRPLVAIEIDGWDEHRAWSVVARGAADTPDLPADIRHLQSLRLASWNPTHKSVYVEVTPSTVEGRRFARVVHPETFPLTRVP